ncbi:unnamed protein product [Miscanthus lutarioriparius]|uniref:Protein kinase domain-containing protein n=1 Tax=Miscanthus lutarioriparius TaxID=422564 RepID=A0A811PA13_9POAL|nr:unnamed protein product [Miscanthus lutarioriparius]
MGEEIKERSHHNYCIKLILMESFRSPRTSKPQRCSPPRLLMLAILITSLQQLATAVDATTTDSDCPTATCGNLTITYPFTLARRGESSCGPTAFQLTCNTSASGGAFLATSYMRVLAIDYGSRSLVAVHVLMAADAACTVIFNVSSAFAITDRFTISASNRELYIMSRCSGTLPPLGAVPVTNCSGNSSLTFAYLGGGYGTGRPPANDGRCELAVFPVLGSEADGATSASYRRLIRGGFRLEWERVGDCNACRASGGRCRYDASTAAFACLCSDGILRSSTCDGKRTRKLALIGLEYLHQGCNTRIIHFDIKPHNILLDNEFCPKISDFGLAKLCRLNGSILSTAEARGTVGFIAPEVFSRAFGAVSTKSDVYSYGMMLLEMIRGKTNMKGSADNSSEAFFPHLLYDHLAGDKQGCQVEDGTEEVARKLTSVGLFCIQMAPDGRPSMSRVIEMLEKSASEFEMPPKPFLYSPFQSANASTITTVMVPMSS